MARQASSCARASIGRPIAAARYLLTCLLCAGLASASAASMDLQQQRTLARYSTQPPTPAAPTPTPSAAPTAAPTWAPTASPSAWQTPEPSPEPAPTPVAPTPVAPTPVAPTPVAPTPVAPTPVAPTPVAPTPVAPTPVAPTPVAPTAKPISAGKPVTIKVSTTLNGVTSLTDDDKKAFECGIASLISIDDCSRVTITGTTVVNSRRRLANAGGSNLRKLTSSLRVDYQVSGFTAGTDDAAIDTVTSSVQSVSAADLNTAMASQAATLGITVTAHVDSMSTDIPVTAAVTPAPTPAPTSACGAQYDACNADTECSACLDMLPTNTDAATRDSYTCADLKAFVDGSNGQCKLGDDLLMAVAECEFPGAYSSADAADDCASDTSGSARTYVSSAVAAIAAIALAVLA